MLQQNTQNCVRMFLDEFSNSKTAIALTGAGVSVASGIPDFRSKDGLYSIISPKTFELDFLFEKPAEYYRIAKEYIHPLADKEPNDTHFMLAMLEKRGLLKAIITQNIDRLHHKAGAKKVIEYHGNVLTFTCTACGKKFDRKTIDLKLQRNDIPACDCGALIRPDIVFFGDPIPPAAIQTSQKYAENADLFVTLGSSLSVYPAASLPAIAKSKGSKLIIVNRDPTPMDRYADHVFNVDLDEFSREVILQLKK